MGQILIRISSTDQAGVPGVPQAPETSKQWERKNYVLTALNLYPFCLLMG